MDNCKYRKFTKSSKLKFGDFLADSAKLMLNSVTTPIETVSGRDFYQPEFKGQAFEEVNKVTSKIQGMATDVAGNLALGPMYSAGKSAIQSGVNIADPNGEQYNNGLGDIGNSIAGQLSTQLPQMNYGGKMPKYYNMGGGLTEINSGGTHEQNPMGGIPIGDKALVEQGETIDTNNQYVFSDSIYIDKDIAKEFGFKNAVGKSFATYSKQLNKLVREGDRMDSKAQEKMNARLIEAQESYKEKIFGDRLQENMKMRMGGDLYSHYSSGKLNYPKMALGGNLKDPVKKGSKEYYEALERNRANYQKLTGLKDEDLFQNMGEYKEGVRRLYELKDIKDSEERNLTEEEEKELKFLFSKTEASVPYYGYNEDGSMMTYYINDDNKSDWQYINPNYGLPASTDISKGPMKTLNQYGRFEEGSYKKDNTTKNSKGEVVSKIPTKEELEAFLNSTENKTIKGNLEELELSPNPDMRINAVDESTLDFPQNNPTPPEKNNTPSNPYYSKQKPPSYSQWLLSNPEGTMDDYQLFKRGLNTFYGRDSIQPINNNARLENKNQGLKPNTTGLQSSSYKPGNANNYPDGFWTEGMFDENTEIDPNIIQEQKRQERMKMTGQFEEDPSLTIPPNYNGDVIAPKSSYDPYKENYQMPIKGPNSPLTRAERRSLNSSGAPDPRTPNEYQADWGYIGQEAARLAPAIANFASGLKSDKLNYEDYRIKSKVKPYFMNIDPMLQDAKEGYVGALDATRNAVGGNAGTYLSNLSALQTGKAKNEYQARVGKFNADNQSVNAAQLANINTEARNMAQKFSVDDWNMRSSEAAKNMTREGFANIGQYADAKAQEAIWDEYIKATAPDYYSNRIKRGVRKPKNNVAD